MSDKSTPGDVCHRTKYLKINIFFNQKNILMTLADVTLIAKKIGVGIVVTIVPFIIIFGGLWLTQTLLSKNQQPTIVQSKTTTPHATGTGN